MTVAEQKAMEAVVSISRSLKAIEHELKNVHLGGPRCVSVSGAVAPLVGLLVAIREDFYFIGGKVLCPNFNDAAAFVVWLEDNGVRKTDIDKMNISTDE